MSDFYRDSAERRLAQLSANRAASIADLEAHKLNGDHDAAGEVIQNLANIDAERANLTQLYQSYVQSQQPRQPDVLTDEERNARPWHKMTADDGLQLAKTSKYGKSLDWNDPHVRAGYVEAQNRRHRGE
jgi:hypothetical protein